MAKKKKKSSLTKSQQLEAPSPSTPLRPSQSHHHDADIKSFNMTSDVEEYLDLQLKRPGSKASSASILKLGFSPILSLDEIDASRISVQQNDRVVVLLRRPKDSQGSLVGTLLCKVDIVGTLSARSPDKKRPNIARGTCHIQPQYMVDAILEEEIDSKQDQEPVETTKERTPSTTIRTPSSKSGFSFAVGGGGDTLITSPSPSSLSTPASTNKIATPTSRSTPSKTTNPRSTVPVWVIPLASPLGKDTASIICQTAKHIHFNILSPVDDSSSSTRLSSCGRILERLVLAQCTGRHVHVSDVITISFQGKPLQLQIQRIESTTTTDERSRLLLELEMENLELQDELPDEKQQQQPMELESKLWKLLRSSLDKRDRPQRVVLSQICKDTTLTFSATKTGEENNTFHNAGSSSPSDPISPPASSPSLSLVAGLSPTMKRLRSMLLTPLLKPELFSRGSLKAPRGVLLYGSSGVGKTCLARQLAHDLTRDHPTLIRVEFVSCASLQSYSAQVGEAEKRLCSIFERASLPIIQGGNNTNGGTLLIFDEIHLIGRKRSGYNPGLDRLVATLLGLLDGIGSASSKQQPQNTIGGAISNSIVILAITSDPTTLDPALRRPGRLDFEVEVPAPDDAATRAEIIDFHLKDLGKVFAVPQFTEEQLLTLGGLAKGFTGADCLLGVKEAFRTAITRRHKAARNQSLSAEQRDSVGGESSGEQLTFADLKSAIRATRPSAIKSITIEIPKVHWSSIGGMETVKRELREAIELPLTHAHLFEKLRIPPPRGILLYGPPGCSKTLMARALATEGQMNFLAVKGPELLSKWLGESERALASLFRRARMASPSIIFFDEIDAIAATRDSAGIGSGGGRLLSQLLTELDGVNQTGGVTIGGSTGKNPKVVVVAATNRPDLIDSALMRPGRIDKKIYVGVPDEKSRTRIFEIGLRDRACSDCVDVTKLAADEVSRGFSGAELIAVCKDAALLALEEDELSPHNDGELPNIKMTHLLKALCAMKRQITPEMIEFYESFRRSS